MKVRTIREINDDKGNVIPIGTINERPDSYFWIGLGNAVAVDDEAKAWEAIYEGQRQRSRATVQRAAKEAQDKYLADAEAAEKERQAEFESILLEGT